MVDLIYSSNTLFTDEKGMKSSFLINDQGVLSIYADHFFYKGRDIEISVEKSRIKETSVINKSIGLFEYIQIIVVNLILVSGYMSYSGKNILLLASLITLANLILYFPIFREKWLKIVYIESGEDKTAYFKPLGVLNLFSSWGLNTNDCDRILKSLAEE